MNNPRRVLVIEQGQEVQEFLLQALAPGSSVALARSLGQARAILGSRGEFDLIAIDEETSCGHLSWEAITELTQSQGQTPILLFSNWASASKYARATDAGLSAIVLKPVLIPGAILARAPAGPELPRPTGAEPVTDPR